MQSPELQKREQERLELPIIKTYAPPMKGLRGLARFLFSRKTADGVFEQMIEDVEEEYFEALAGGDKWGARHIKSNGHQPDIECYGQD